MFTWTLDRWTGALGHLYTLYLEASRNKRIKVYNMKLHLGHQRAKYTQGYLARALEAPVVSFDVDHLYIGVITDKSALPSKKLHNAPTMQ